MNLYNLCIEVTRKCNLKCKHCLRGPAQNIDIDTNIIDKFFELNNVKATSLLLTGGEPLLNMRGINEIAEILIRRKIVLYDFVMVTNGTIFDPAMLIPLSKFYNLVDDKDYFWIYISKDEFHNKPIDNRWNLLKYDYKKLGNIISEGRGEKLNRFGKKPQEYEWIVDNENLDGTVYINALGHICKDCDYSYKTQDKKNYGICISKELKDFMETKNNAQD